MEVKVFQELKKHYLTSPIFLMIFFIFVFFCFLGVKKLLAYRDFLEELQNLFGNPLSSFAASSNPSGNLIFQYLHDSIETMKTNPEKR